MIKTCMDNVREKAPLVHNITNYIFVKYNRQVGKKS